MEKKKGKIKEVNDKYDILLEGEDKWLTPVDKVKQYVNESIIGSEVDLVIQNDKITFLKVLDGGTQQSNNGGDKNEVADLLKKINWNFGTLVKQQRLYYLFQISEIFGKERESIRERISKYFSKGLDKDLEQLEKIKEEQEKK